MKSIFLITGFLILFCCSGDKTHDKSIADSLRLADSLSLPVVPETVYYQIPDSHPWLVKFIDHPFLWDCSCCKATTLDSIALPVGKVSRTTNDNQRISKYSSGDSYIVVTEDASPESQMCSDNICEINFSAAWIPLRYGLQVGMNRSDFLRALGLDKSIVKNEFVFMYQPKDSRRCNMKFVLKDDTLALLTYELDPCGPWRTSTPADPFYVDLFKKPFKSMDIDVVQKMIGGKIAFRVLRNNAYFDVDKISISDYDVDVLFENSTISFKKPSSDWDIVSLDLRSPRFQFSNGLRVGMTRQAFKELMDEPGTDGDSFNWRNPYCNDGFDQKNDLTVNFENDIITQIVYDRGPCN